MQHRFQQAFGPSSTSEVPSRSTHSSFIQHARQNEATAINKKTRMHVYVMQSFFIYIYTYIYVNVCTYIPMRITFHMIYIYIYIYMYMRAGSCKLRHHIPRSRKHKFLRGLNFHQRHRCRRLNLTSHIISMVPLAFQVLNTPKPPSPQPQNYNIETELQPLLAPPLAPRSHRLCLGTRIHQGPGLAEHEWLCTHPLYLP